MREWMWKDSKHTSNSLHPHRELCCVRASWGQGWKAENDFVVQKHLTPNALIEWTDFSLKSFKTREKKLNKTATQLLLTDRIKTTAPHLTHLFGKALYFLREKNDVYFNLYSSFIYQVGHKIITRHEEAGKRNPQSREEIITRYRPIYDPELEFASKDSRITNLCCKQYKKKKNSYSGPKNTISDIKPKGGNEQYWKR